MTPIDPQSPALGHHGASEGHPVIVGDVAIFTDAWGNVVLRSGADGRHRIAIPAADRAAVAAALLPPQTVAVDVGRLERLLLVAELAHEWLNAPEDSSIGRRAEDALTHAVDALQTADLDPVVGDDAPGREG